MVGGYELERTIFKNPETDANDVFSREIRSVSTMAFISFLVGALEGFCHHQQQTYSPLNTG